jgi:ketosteroid isomerase-like protein
VTDADQQTKDEIIKLAHELLDAMRRRDRPTLERIIADDFIISGWQPDGRLADKKFYVDDAMRPVDIQEGSYHYDNWQFRFYGDTAVVNCTLDIRAVVNGYEWGGEVLITDVWIRDQDSWRVVTRHTSPIVRTEQPGAEKSEKSAEA